MALVHESTTLTALGSSVDQGGGVARITFNMPAVSDTHAYLAFIGIDDDDYGGSDSDLNGWAIVTDGVNSYRTIGLDALGSASGWVLWRNNHDASATSFIDVNGGAGETFNVAVLRYSGQHATDFIGLVAALNSGLGSTATAPAGDAEEGDSLILRVAWVDTASPNGWAGGTERVDMNAGSGRCGVGVAEESSPGASTTTGTLDLTLTASDDWEAGTFEILVAGAAGITIDATTGVLTVSGPVADIMTGVALDVPSAVITLGGIGPEIATGLNIEVPLNAITLSGADPDIVIGQAIEVTLGQVTLSGNDPAIQTGRSIQATAGQISLSGVDPIISQGIAVESASNTLTLTGLDAELVGPLTVDVDVSPATITLFGPNPDLVGALLQRQRSSVHFGKGTGNESVRKEFTTVGRDNVSEPSEG